VGLLPLSPRGSSPHFDNRQCQTSYPKNRAKERKPALFKDDEGSFASFERIVIVLPSKQDQRCNDSIVDERDAAQAAELVRALRDQLHQMTHQLVRLECQDVSGRSSRASAIRCEAAALRRDIDEAQILIDRLQRRYLNSDGHAQPRRPAKQPRRSAARVQRDLEHRGC
jgi:hypothetical protein